MLLAATSSAKIIIEAHNVLLYLLIFKQNQDGVTIFMFQLYNIQANHRARRVGRYNIIFQYFSLNDLSTGTCKTWRPGQKFKVAISKANMRMHRSGGGGGGGGGESRIPGKSQAIIWVSVIGPSPEKVGSPGNVCTALKPWKMIVFFL